MRDPDFSLLFKEKCCKLESIQPVFFADLQLEKICKAIVSKYKDFDLKKYFYTLPHSQQTVLFRQNIYRDLEQNPFMITALKQYTNRILACEKCYQFYCQMDDEIKKGSYLLITCEHYLSAITLLRDTLERAALSSEGFQTLRQMLRDKQEDSVFLSFEESVRRSFSYMEQMKLNFLVKEREISVLEGTENVQSIVEELKRCMEEFDVPVEESWRQLSDEITNLFPTPLETVPLENTIIDILRKSRPEIFQVLREFATVSFNPEEDVFAGLKNEIVFYISFYEFEQSLNETGYFLQYPLIANDGEMTIKDVYDVALVWNNRFSGYDVIRNDISYQPGKSFLVITGPNQGGKTTLARAMGQSVYFMLLGLKAPCTFMKSRYFERILTHFEVEESVETGAGKLKEELMRLKPMMKFYGKGSFVILNELFTTATTYDAQIMAQKVMTHFIENESLGIYVTHIQELADETEENRIQSMVAQVDEKDPSVRTFKILPRKAEGFGYSDSIVKKYELDFEHVAEKIANL